MTSNTETSQELQPAPLPRRLGAMLYDAMIIMAIWMVVGAIGVGLNGGQAVTGPLFSSLLFLVTFGFFAGFWTRRGQTLGMLAWRLRIQTLDGYPISLMQALLRFFTAIAALLPLGLGLWWSLIDKQKLAWHDRYSETRLVLLPAAAKKKP